MKTAREMVAKLKNLKNQINVKTRQFENLHKRHKMASQGNMKFVNGRVNKNTYTNANYMRNIHNAMRIVYNERKPLMNKYNKTAKKYRGILGLPGAGMPGYVRGPTYQWNWQKKNHVNFSRSKRTENGRTPSVTNLYTKYQPLGATSSSGGGAHNSRVTLGAYYTKFHPNNQLNNTIRKKIAGKLISNTLLARIYRPSNNNKRNEGGAMFKKALASFHRS
jgi:hypothetical protein